LKFLANASWFKFKKKMKAEVRSEGSEVSVVEDVDELTESRELK
jgi:hypothetical protein